MRSKLFTLISACLSFLALSFTGCIEDSETDLDDGFDRQAMLINWADNIIMPAYNHYYSALLDLQNAATTFTGSTTEANLISLKSEFEAAYTAWQRVSMFEIGKAEEVTLRSFTNIFPTDADRIDAAIESGSYDFTLPSSRAIQGFPALDYLLYGYGDNTATLTAFQNAVRQEYLNAIVDRMLVLTGVVVQDWSSGYRDTFVQNDGSDATSSVNKLTNDYLFYYEKYLRAGKVGIPAGKFSSATTFPEYVEAPYNGEISRDLLLTALNAADDFFNGRHFDGTEDGIGLNDYLDYLNAITDGADLNALINDQFESARVAINALQDNLKQQVADDNTAMLVAYDELQKNVILMKVDMYQALNIRADYVDADGD